MSHSDYSEVLAADAPAACQGAHNLCRTREAQAADAPAACRGTHKLCLTSEALAADAPAACQGAHNLCRTSVTVAADAPAACQGAHNLCRTSVTVAQTRLLPVRAHTTSVALVLIDTSCHLHPLVTRSCRTRATAHTFTL